MLYFLRQSIHKYFLKAHKYEYYIEFDDQPAPVAYRSPIHWHCSQSVRMCAIFLVHAKLIQSISPPDSLLALLRRGTCPINDPCVTELREPLSGRLSWRAAMI